MAEGSLGEFSLLGGKNALGNRPNVHQKQPTLILGLDIGVFGAGAILSGDGDLVDVFDMPVLADGQKGRRSVNAPLLTDIIFKSHATCAFVEFVGARPGEGAVGAFAFGRSRGVIEGVLAAAGIPVTFITPASWKRAVGLTLATKDAARAEAIRRWPSQASLFARVKDDGRAEACLIAVAGMMRQTPNSQFPEALSFEKTAVSRARETADHGHLAFNLEPEN